MSSTTTTTALKTAEDRLAVILSNQYHRHMCRNRPQWYGDSPLDTAPKYFAPRMRKEVPYIRDWEWKAYYRMVANKAACMGKDFSDQHYGINGVIWSWQDPATNFLVGLFTSDTMETVEFAISSDPFWAPHLVVTHSPGNEPQCLDRLGNPDQLTDAQPAAIPNVWGCTPRQSFVGPTGKEQLFLPPRMSLRPERDAHAELCVAAIISRQSGMLRRSIQFHEGLRKIRARRELLRSVDKNLNKVDLSERGRQFDHNDLSNSQVAVSEVKSEEPDFEPMSQEEIKSSGFSDSDAAESLFTRCGIMFQPHLDDLNLLADSAVLSEESEDEDKDEDKYEDEDEGEDEESSPSLPHSPTIASDTFEVLRRLGMVHGDATDGEDEVDEEEEEEEEEADEEAGDEGDEEDESEDENEDEGDETTGDLAVSDPKISISEPMSHQDDVSPSLWSARPPIFPISTGSLDLVSIFHKDADEEQSSVSSLFVGDDQDSIASDCETPDTEEEC